MRKRARAKALANSERSEQAGTEDGGRTMAIGHAPIRLQGAAAKASSDNASGVKCASAQRAKPLAKSRHDAFDGWLFDGDVGDGHRAQEFFQEFSRGNLIAGENE